VPDDNISKTPVLPFPNSDEGASFPGS